MNNKSFSQLILCFALIILGCSKEDIMSEELIDQSVSSKSVGSQLGGIGYFATDAECDSPGEGATFAVKMTGDLEGCLFIFVDTYECTPGGAYMEVGREYFVGTYNGGSGSFWTTYKFEAKFEGCNDDGSYLGAEILGRCQHPIVVGSGEGVFAGVTGRFDMKDDIEAGNYPYKGHIQY